MRAASMSVWIFINILCFGMCGYMYLVWYQVWMYSEGDITSNKLESLQSDNRRSGYKETITYSALNNSFRKTRRSAVGSLKRILSKQTSNNISGTQHNPKHKSNKIVISRQTGRPRFSSTMRWMTFDYRAYICNEPISPACEKQTAEFKKLLYVDFINTLKEYSGWDDQNIYDLKYNKSKRYLSEESSRDQILCALKNVNLRTVTANDEPFATLKFLIPEKLLQEPRHYNRCAVVTSAGALLDSRLGEFIDSHDMVLRFNNAPTVNYTDHVGSKTTFRVLNSQVVAKPEFNFLENPLFKNVSILIWDPAKDSSTLEAWYNNTEHQFFPIYKKLLETRPDADVHVLHPQVLWKLWTILQDTSVYKLRKNPPSSGFIGLWFALQRCSQVRIFEYVPSVHATRRCHYYAPDADDACTLGAWHPLAHEKILADRMRHNSDIQVFQAGYIDVSGFNNFNNCTNNPPK